MDANWSSVFGQPLFRNGMLKKRAVCAEVTNGPVGPKTSSGGRAASRVDRVSGLTCLKSAMTSTVGGVRLLYLGMFAGNFRQRAKLARPGLRW